MRGTTLSCVSACDLHPNHIFISDKPSVIDFGDMRDGWPSEDLASFLAYCAVYKTAISPMRISLDSLQSIFLRTYASKIKFESDGNEILELSYIRELLGGFSTRWRRAAGNLTLIKRASWRTWSNWTSWLANREIGKRVETGRWRTLIG